MTNSGMTNGGMTNGGMTNSDTRNGDLTPARPARGQDAGDLRPYRISVPQAQLDALRERLTRTRWTQDLPGTGWERGVPVSYLRDLAGYWAGRFDWRAAEQALNA